MYERELTAAREAATRAGAVILDLYRSFVAIADAPISISTAADRDSQEAILTYLAAAFPGDAFRAEEATPTYAALPHSGERLWVIDPVDGSRGFAMKNGEFSVMIAFAVGGRVVVGVVAEPALDRCTYAVRGGGCRTERGERATVSAVTELSQATLTQSHSRPGRGPTVAVQKLAPARIMETYSAGIKLAQVARGEADLYPCDYDALNDWDLAAGHILVEEAGGRVTDLFGREIRYGMGSAVHAGGILATNGLLHKSAVKTWTA